MQTEALMRVHGPLLVLDEMMGRLIGDRHPDATISAVPCPMIAWLRTNPLRCNGRRGCPYTVAKPLESARKSWPLRWK